MSEEAGQQDSARLANWKCSTTLGGGIQCRHTAVDTVLDIQLEGISGVVEIPSWAETYDVDLDLRNPAHEEVDF